MELQEQIEFCQTIEKKFLDLDRSFLQYEEYDGVFGEDAERMGHVLESLWRLQDLEH